MKRIGFLPTPVALAWIASTLGVSLLSGQTPPGQTRCPSSLDFHFEQEVWAQVISRHCLSCHRKGGDAEESSMVFVDPAPLIGQNRTEAVKANLARLTRMVEKQEKGAGEESSQPRLLLKVQGKSDHGGGSILKVDSTEYKILERFTHQLSRSPGKTPNPADFKVDTRSFFEGVTFLENPQLLRRATLSLGGRLPTESEKSRVARDGLKAIPSILDDLMREEGFYERLREGFNDIFLTLGIDGNADQTVLSYEHFEKTRHWYQKFDLSHIQDKNERQRTEWKIAAEYRKALLGEPMRLVDHIVRNDRPFTEIATADYLLVSPYSARGYGVFEEVKGKFRNPQDPFEYVPVKLKALKGRNRSEDQDSPTGFYPHAGLLGMFQYLTRYPTTETNRNRLRARMYYQHFLGVDVLELASRVSDAAAVSARYKVPTMEAPECVVCHKTLDPVAGLFQDYWKFADQGVYGKRKGGWFTDMFSPGFEGESLPAQDRWRALQWLGEKTIQDPRFAIAMTENVYFILFGRKPLQAPRDFNDPHHSARWRAYKRQRQLIETIAGRFRSGGYQLKSVFKDWVLSEDYRANGVAATPRDPCRVTELEDLGLMRLLTPEQLERKVKAVFGEKWGRLHDEMAMLYGGIDSKEVTDRPSDPSGAMGAIQRSLSNDVACRQVALDFTRSPKDRRLFPGIEPSMIPGKEASTDQAIRKGIAFLHEQILGRLDAPDSAEVDRTFGLFSDLVQEASKQKGLEKREIYHCRPHDRDRPGTTAEDPHYTIRAWRGVVTYLLRRPEFLYE